MKAKQVIAVVIACVVIVATGLVGVATNALQAKQTETKKEKTSIWTSDFLSEEIVLPTEDFVGQVNVEGEIMPSSDDVFSTIGGYDHDATMKYVDAMIEAENNKGILLYINTPGGTVYESDELYLKLMEYKKVTGRPIWAYFGAEACSGGYYIAMAADHIVANRNCWTGSIGVVISLVNCKELYDKLGVKEIDIASGDNKAMGAMGADLVAEQYNILQGLVDEAYDQFVGIVCEGRKLDEKTVRKLADGRIYSAKQAMEHKLVDAVGSLEEEKAAFAKQYKFPEDITYFEPEDEMADFWGNLFAAIRKVSPKTELELATDIVENRGNGVLKYYAK